MHRPSLPPSVLGDPEHLHHVPQHAHSVRMSSGALIFLNLRSYCWPSSICLSSILRICSHSFMMQVAPEMSHSGPHYLVAPPCPSRVGCPSDSLLANRMGQKGWAVTSEIQSSRQASSSVLSALLQVPSHHDVGHEGAWGEAPMTRD